MYFELKAFETPQEKPPGFKTKIQLTVGTSFTANTEQEIGKEKFNPKKVRDLLLFVANDLIPRLVIKTNERDFEKYLKDLNYQKEPNQTWDDFYVNCPPDQLAKFKEDEGKMLQYAISRLDELNVIKVPDITQFNFDELSPGKLASSTQTIVNTNVPPPKR